MENFLALLALLLPLTLSPGPATIALSGVAMNKGMVNSLPFYFGLLSSAVIIIIGCGFGLNQILFSNTIIYKTIYYAGIIYIFYLSYKFFRIATPSETQTKNSHSIYDGMLLNALNPKFYVMVAVLFSQFLNPDQKNLWPLVLIIIFVMAISLFIWLAFGAGIKNLIKSKKALYTQSLIFGMLLMGVGVYMFLRNI